MPAKTAIHRLGFLKNSNVPNGTLLDVGAGGGEFVYVAGRSGFQSKGVEPNIGYSEFANGEYGCEVVTGDLDSVTGKFDLITMFHVMEHMPSPIKAFEKLHGLLNERGRLFIEVPWIETNDASPHNSFFKAHIFYFSLDTLIACASPFFNVQTADTSSNLKVLFEAKDEPGSLELPAKESVKRLRRRLNRKGWVEYLFKGKGIIKPIRKIARSIEESRSLTSEPKKILDDILREA